MNDSTCPASATVVILAAGFSSRFGSCKFLMPLPDGNTFLKRLCISFDQAFIDRIIVVVNPQQWEQVVNLDLGSNTEVILNPHPELERFYSLLTGLQACRDSSYVFIHNADMPEISPQTIRDLWNSRKHDGYMVPTFEGRSGHPVLVNNSIVRSLLCKPLNSKLNEALSTHCRNVVAVPDSGILRDIDTFADYESLMARQ